jgi:hypothetical protein
MSGKKSKKGETADARKPATPKEDIRAENPRSLQVRLKEGETKSKAYSRVMTSPSANASITMLNFHSMKEGVNITDLVEEVRDQVAAIQNGSMGRPEALLSAQAHTLDTIFNALAQKAAANMNAGYLPASETYLRMALKAQSQCRTTLEALAEIKFPRSATFIKQANIADQQQVNNGQAGNATSTRTGARAHEKDITPANELLMESRHAALDAGGTGTTGGLNSALATVGAVDRAKH